MRRRRIITGLSFLAATAAIAVASPPASGAVTLATHHPRIGATAPGGQTTNAGWASSNWSGYALSSSTYNAITGSWTVTPVARSSRSTYSSTWIGIDGFNNSDLIQTGTEADYYGGAAHYYAWWEILPAYETLISGITVHPGDKMSASILHTSGSSWSITLTDTSTGASFNTTQSYAGPGTSAEWIQEAPTVGGRIANLANYGSPLTIDPGTVNGGNPNLVANDSGVMIQHGAQVSTPSTPDSDNGGDGFNMAYGSHAPAPPAS